MSQPCHNSQPLNQHLCHSLSKVSKCGLLSYIIFRISLTYYHIYLTPSQHLLPNTSPLQVTKKEHPMYWKGKSQSSGLMGYFPSEYVKMYSLSRQDSTASISSLSVRSPSISSQHKLYDFSWFVGEMDRNGGRYVELIC